MKIKIPTYKKLKINLKYYLINSNPKTFNEWKAKYENLFLKYLKSWMYKENIDFKLIPKYYEIMFYWGFINYKRETKLINLLLKNKYEVKRSNLKLDAIFKVDLIAIKDKTKYFIQLKNTKSNLSEDERMTLIHYSNLKQAIPILVYVKQKDFIFLNLTNNSEIKLLDTIINIY
ncbi:excisionase [Metamycoplasma hyosynoviae]|uniref:excisionase n=1 Tax=Metamycoplasma hyosynoviae TaxID=29559 RepID=UPI002365F0AB|nr:excisionase [Metamycoplasma hyosynoviae]MDD7907987.1 excisionase [Metamycoplasma hyosynoviae]